ncbi:MAG: hypothetical protein R6V27_11235 [Balneolaceae bacterium]
MQIIKGWDKIGRSATGWKKKQNRVVNKLKRTISMALPGNSLFEIEEA